MSVLAPVLAIAFLVAFSAAVVALVADWESPIIRLHTRCLRWGILRPPVRETAAVVGLVGGIADGAIGLALIAAMYGLVVGTFVAVIPSIVGGLVVAGQG